jgi:hypothetical protein
LANFQSQMAVGCMHDTSALFTTRKICWVICQILVESKLPLVQKDGKCMCFCTQPPFL